MIFNELPDEPQIPGADQVEQIFRDIGAKVRSTGRTELLLILDRVPGQVIGRENAKDNAIIESHLAESLEILRDVQSELEKIKLQSY